MWLPDCPLGESVIPEQEGSNGECSLLSFFIVSPGGGVKGGAWSPGEQ